MTAGRSRRGESNPVRRIRFCFVALVEKQSVDPRFAIDRRVGLVPGDRQALTQGVMSPRLWNTAPTASTKALSRGSVALPANRVCRLDSASQTGPERGHFAMCR